MENKPLISVCIPVYNSAEYLDRCLGSLTRQTYDNLEIIMVIDGVMEDDSLRICREWEKLDHRIKVIEQKHGGLPVARNTGIENVSGDFIGFVDPDDYIEKDMYERLLSGIQSAAGIDICIEGYIEQEEGQKGVQRECFDKVLTARDAVSMMINQEVSDYPWNKLYRKRLFDNLRYPEGNNFYDVGTTYKFLELSNKICLIPYAGYHYIRRKNSLTSGRRIPDFLDSLEMYLERYDDLIVKRKDLRQGLCKGVYGSSISLAAACLVSGKENRKKFKKRKTKAIRRMLAVKRMNRSMYSLLERFILNLSASNHLVVLVICLSLEQCRRWVKGK